MGIGVIKQDSVFDGDSEAGTSVKLISRNSTGMSNMAAVGIRYYTVGIRYYFLRGFQNGEIKKLTLRIS